MSLILPTDPAPNHMGIALVSTKNTLTPATGGDEQEIRRKGSKYALTFSMLMTYVQSMDWGDLMAEGETVVMRVFQPGLVIGAPGTPLVKGGSQIGSSLLIDGLTPGYVIRKDQFMSVITGGQRFLYRAHSLVTANGSGEATVPLRTLLRRPPTDNAVIEIAQPMVEGFAKDVSDIEVGVDRLVRLQFTVRERE